MVTAVDRCLPVLVARLWHGLRSPSRPFRITTMAVSTRVELMEALVAHQFDRLVGTVESDWVDFKEQPYDLSTPAGKWELAKDVAAFANQQGGCIVLGVRTEKSDQERRDVATAIHEIPKGLIDRSRYRDV